MVCFHYPGAFYRGYTIGFIERLRKTGDDISEDLLKPIDQVSELSVDKFYQTLKGQKQPCIKFYNPEFYPSP